MPDSFVALESEREGLQSIILKDESEQNSSFIIIEAESDVFLASPFYEKLGFSGTYQFERALYEEKFGLLLMLFRDFLFNGKNTKVAEFNQPEVKGFIRSSIKHNTMSITIYDKENRDVGYMHFVGKIPSSEDVFTKVGSLIKLL